LGLGSTRSGLGFDAVKCTALGRHGLLNTPQSSCYTSASVCYSSTLTFRVFKVQWLHFTGKVENKRKPAYVNFFGILCTKKIFKSLHF